MSEDIAIATWGLVFVTAVLAIITAYYAKQTRDLVSRERRALQVALLKDELEQAIGPLFAFASAVRAAFEKQHRTIDLNAITDGFETELVLYLKRDYIDELVLRNSHLIDPQIAKHWIKEQWVRGSLDRKLDYVGIHVNKGTVAWIQGIEQKYSELKKRYEELTSVS
jgi:hypothetical protein